MRDARWIGGLVIAASFATACGGGATLFEGREHLAIVGTPPAPPPPPPPPPPPTPPPPEPPKRVQVTEKAIVITEKIQFDLAKATIKPVSFGLLDEIADVINKNPRIKRISVEGHASAEGPATLNLKLSDARAHSVAKYLSDHGVEPNRLEPKGYGITRPIGDNKTEEGREKNRRVEFNILEQDTVTHTVTQ